MKSVQETYAPNNRCFGCGPANDRGLRIRSFEQGDELVCEWRPQPHAFDETGAVETRMLVWEGLTGPAEPDAADDFFPGLVEDMRRRQAGGELAADLDPAYVLLLLFAAAAAPVLLPHVAERMTGLPADSTEFLDGYRAQLRGIVERLAR